MDRMALGDYGAFKWWSGQPKSWGPDGAGWQAWFGGKVVDGLCGVLDEHLSSRRRGEPAAIGCVPWLTSEAVVDRLLGLTSCCVVLDKGAYFPQRLVESEKAFPNIALPSLELMTPAVDGETPILGPSSPRPEHDIGPVRVVGWRGRESGKPLLHAKLLVLGHLRDVVYDTGEGEYSEWRFVPHSVWWGSANWTEAARSHLEVGFWCDDQTLAKEATSFVADLIAFSEPVDTLCPGPEPNLVHCDFDDEAMAEAAREMWLDHLAQEADDDPDGG